jgi:hypothetical protein
MRAECIKESFNQRGMNGFKLIKYLNRFKFQREIMGYYNVFLLKFNSFGGGEITDYPDTGSRLVNTLHKINYAEFCEFLRFDRKQLRPGMTATSR